MEKREQVLREALAKNAEETQRWESYENENLQAIDNLENFSKKLYVDVMVPIGRKAFMPGKLMHTNEVLVGHYQGYFSKCSGFKATEICRYRLKMAKEQLQKLQTECELWQNKLDKPYIDGVVPNFEEREIIEEYDENKEKIWREKHIQRVRQAKLQEKKEQAEAQKLDSDNESNDNIMKLLEDAELMEELEAELDTLQMNGDMDTDMLQKLISGEIKLAPETKRISHRQGLEVESEKGTQPNVVKKSELKSHLLLQTNNNSQLNPELLFADSEGNDSDSSVSSDTLEEVKFMENQAKFLSREDQIGFYEYQLQIINKRILTCPVENKEQIEEKLQLFKVRDHVEDILDCIEEEEGDSELVDTEIEDPIDTTKNVTEVPLKGTSSQNRRISFALEDQTLEFRKNETVANMILKPLSTEQSLKRDIIQLDEPLAGIKCEKYKGNISTATNKPRTIIDKVEDNMDFVAETQSVQDFNLVNNIINSSSGKSRTLRIHFKHSEQTNSNVAENSVTNHSSSLPRTPAELYEIIVPSEGYQKLQQKSISHSIDGKTDYDKMPILKEADRVAAYKDMRVEFSKPGALKQKEPASDSSNQTKSILRNKKVEQETCIDNKIASKNGPKKKKKAITKEDDCTSAYFKVMGDVIENQIIAPEPLPEEKFIDAHEPKKRMSRFKQMRAVRP